MYLYANDTNALINCIGVAFNNAFIIGLIFLLVFKEGYAQNQKLRFEHLTADQGLSDNTGIRIMQDRKGYGWIATYNEQI